MFWLALVFCLIGLSRSDTHLHSFVTTDIDGNKYDMAQLEGKVVLIVNVASECGYTHTHYTQLQQLYEELEPTGRFVILGFPCNQFGGQEPGGAKQIKDFVAKYSVTFPIMQKVDVIQENADSLWKFLAKTSEVSPTWNFFKYLFDGNGDIINVWAPNTAVKDLTDTIRTVVHEEEMHQIQMERPDSPFIHDEF
eukprot:TRINITY_DN5123_c0_g1_i1.p1 TRINITY_DN5123_c0_g1~~TRINITY_DN5123_c0_g1_i1.p1  ORF type:complete len:194 (+),score=20.68 TRINITY_DN5123_c0_g1_i1:40-621(+)